MSTDWSVEATGGTVSRCCGSRSDGGTASACGQFATLLQWEPGVERKVRARALRDVLGGMAGTATRSP